MRDRLVAGIAVVDYSMEAFAGIDSPSSASSRARHQLNPEAFDNQYSKYRLGDVSLSLRGFDSYMVTAPSILNIPMKQDVATNPLNIISSLIAHIRELD